MVNRRTVLLSLLATPVPVAAALAQPWWNERAEDEKWHKYEEEERRRHAHWDEQHEHQAWERQQRELAQREWEHEHGPYRP